MGGNMLPNFFVVGAQKSGTTSLHFYLKEHPEIFLPLQKETKFFVRDQLYSKGIDYYESEFFADWSGEMAVGEVDPEYMYIENALERIRLHFDLRKIKFIFVLRNPVERAFSHYLMTYRRGLELLAFDEAIKEEQNRIRQGQQENIDYSYVSRGFYLRQIERFLEYVEKSQLLFVLAEDLKNNQEDCLRNIYEFLDVSPEFKPSNVNKSYHQAKIPRSLWLLHRINNQGYEKKFVRFFLPWKSLRMRLRAKLLNANLKNNDEMFMKTEIKCALIEIFKNENDRLSRFIGRDLTHWNTV